MQATLNIYCTENGVIENFPDDMFWNVKGFEQGFKYLKKVVKDVLLPCPFVRVAEVLMVDLENHKILGETWSLEGKMKAIDDFCENGYLKFTYTEEIPECAK